MRGWYLLIANVVHSGSLANAISLDFGLLKHYPMSIGHWQCLWQNFGSKAPRVSMRRLIVPVLALMLMTGCTHEAPTEDVDKAAAQFFLRLQAAQYDKIYDDADAHFKEQKPRAAVLDDLQKLVGYGRPQDWHRLSMTLGTEAGQKRVAVPLYTLQTDNLTSEISLKFTDNDGEWKLLGFAVTPHAGGGQR
jgi:hypothetical protein